jgi:hypothetical protein
MDSRELQTTQQTLSRNAAHAAKMAHRRAHPEKMQTYAPNRGAGTIAEISDADARYQAKLEARIAAFNAGRKPDEDGFLDVSESKGDVGKKAAPEAPAPAPAADKPSGKGKSESKGDIGKA